MNYNTPLTEAFFYILLSLQSPLHGYGIMQNVEKISGGRIKLAAGTLYGALSNLVERKFIIELAQVNDTRKRAYVITAEGYKVLNNELERLREMVKIGDIVLGGGKND